jgi:CubicO group peptidase (beta-lactamase class C family)
MERVSADQLDGLVREARERWNVPGLAVGVLQEGSVTTAADGACRLGEPEPVTPATVFRIASITKPFTAALALSLAQDDLLDLDAPPPGTTVDATVRQLLSHQGGLAQEWPERLDPAVADDGALLRIAAGEPERLPVGPGELFSYCNVGFWLVAAAAARTLGTTFEQAMQERVLDALGLDATGFEPDRHASGHRQVEAGSDEHLPLETSYPRVRRPSGGLWSTVDDLLRFVSHQLGAPGPLTEESLAQMRLPHARAGTYTYGLGWFMSDLDGRTLVEHGGSVAGFESVLLFVPEDGVALAALTNSSRGDAPIRDLREQLGVWPPERPHAPLAPQELEALAGRYAGQGLELVFAAEDGGLRLDATEVDPFTGETSTTYPSVLARPIGGRNFEIVEGEWRGERFDFPRDGFVCFGALAARVE